jgi:GNAT superfamily N-acetyltransferase
MGVADQVKAVKTESNADAPDKPEWGSRSHIPADREGIRALLHQEYPDSDVGLPQFFKWQYEENPAGEPIIRVAYTCQDGQVVGELWGLPVRLQVADEVRYATLIINGVVRRDFRRRGVVKRIGLESFADALAQRGIDFTFAIPSPASYHVDTRYLHGIDLGRVPLLLKPLDWAALLAYKTGHLKLFRPFSRPLASILKRVIPPEPRAAQAKGITLHAVEHFDASFDALWERTRHKRPVTVVRDRAWLEWRYKQIPTRRYEVRVAQEQGVKLGYVVTRRMELLGVACGMIVDLWVEPTQRGQHAARLLIAAVTRMFLDQGMQIAGALMLPGTPEYAALRQSGYWVCPRFLEPQPIPLTVRWHTGTAPRHPLDDLSCWFFTMGDYDVI